MKKVTMQARKVFKIEKAGSKFVLSRRHGRKVLGKFESYMGAYNARARHFKKAS